MSERIRIGIIGAGQIAQNAHIPGYKAQENLEVVAVCDVVPGKAAQVGAFSVAGVLTVPLLAATLPFAAIAAAALLVGMRVRDCVDADTYRRWLRRVLWVMVVVLTVQFLSGAV